MTEPFKPSNRLPPGRVLRRRPMASLALLRQDAVARDQVGPGPDDFDRPVSFSDLPWEPLSEDELFRPSDLFTGWGRSAAVPAPMGTNRNQTAAKSI